MDAVAWPRIQSRAPPQKTRDDDRENRGNHVARRSEGGARDDHGRLTAALAGESPEPERKERDRDAGEHADDRLPKAQPEREQDAAEGEADDRGVGGEPEPEHPRRATDALLLRGRLERCSLEDEGVRPLEFLIAENDLVLGNPWREDGGRRRIGRAQPSIASNPTWSVASTASSRSTKFVTVELLRRNRERIR